MLINHTLIQVFNTEILFTWSMECIENTSKKNGNQNPLPKKKTQKLKTVKIVSKSRQEADRREPCRSPTVRRGSVSKVNKWWLSCTDIQLRRISFNI